MKHDTDMKRLFLLLLSFGIWVGICRAEEAEEQPYLNQDEHLAQAIRCINDSNWDCVREQLPLVEDWGDNDIYNGRDFTGVSAYIAQLDSVQQADTLVQNLCLHLGWDAELLVEELYIKGDLEGAITYCQLAADIRRAGVGEESPSYVTSLFNLCVLYQQVGKFDLAEANGLKALEYRKKIYGESNERYVATVELMGNFYDEIGNYAKSEVYLKEANTLWAQLAEQNPQEHRYDYGLSFNSLGALYGDKGDFANAESSYLQDLQIIREEKGQDSYPYGVLASSVGITYAAIGDYKQAEYYYTQSAEAFKASGRDRHPMFASLLNNIGSTYIFTKQYGKAIEVLKPALEIIIETAGENTPEYLRIINNLQVAYSESHDFEEAEKYVLQVLELTKEMYGEQSSDYALALNNAGSYYSDINKEVAERYLLQAYDLWCKTLGPDHFYIKNALDNLEGLYYEGKRYPEAEKYLTMSLRSYKHLYVEALTFMSERQRESYWKSMYHMFEKITPRHTWGAYQDGYKMGSLAYNNELFLKGVLLQSSNAVRRSIQESNDTTLIRQWQELMDVKQQIIAAQNSNAVKEGIAVQEQQAEALEKEITRSSAAYRENMRQWTITWDSVRAVLKPRHVAIEYMSAPLNDDTTMYCALLLRDTCSYPIMIPLFEEKEIKGLKDADLSKKIWHNVMPYMNAGETVFFSPTGVLHQIAIENLPYDETRTMGDVYEMVRLSSTRELAMHRTPVKHSSATLYGGIYYQEMDSVTMRQISEQYRTRDMSYEPAMANDTTQRALPKYLPGTQKEIDSIQPILTKRHIAVKLHSKRDACEESVKALSGKKQNIIHLATHGFFWQNTTQSTDPMERCGLLFAGANTALSGHNERLAAGVDDGILTAKEISLLDLRDADVVVLSACETALGDITGEGVFGLQRAFKMAGARTILMALWKVNDDATRMLMTAFYRNYSKGQTKRAAFRNAQQEVRTYTRTETRQVENDSAAGKDKMRKGQSSPITTETITTQPYKDPYYWAGFILLD